MKPEVRTAIMDAEREYRRNKRRVDASAVLVDGELRRLAPELPQRFWWRDWPRAYVFSFSNDQCFFLPWEVLRDCSPQTILRELPRVVDLIRSGEREVHAYLHFNRIAA